MNNYKQIIKTNKLKVCIILSFLLTLVFLLQATVSAAPEDQKVYDDYDLFTDAEEAELEDTLNSYGEEGEVDIVVITTDNLGNRSTKTYLHDFYDEKGLGYDKEFGDTVLLLIYMDPSDRTVEIQCYKNAEYYINNQRSEYVLDAIMPYLRSGDYYEAVEEYAKQVSTYMNTPLPSTSHNNSGGSSGGNSYNNGGNSSYNRGDSYQNSSNSRVDNLIINPLFQLGVSLVIGLVTVGIMAAGAGGRITTHSRTYLDAGHSRVTKSYDNYIRTTTTRIKKPTDNNNNNSGSSGGGGGVSSGGHSHSGASRGF